MSPTGEAYRAWVREHLPNAYLWLTDVAPGPVNWPFLELPLLTVIESVGTGEVPGVIFQQHVESWSELQHEHFATGFERFKRMMEAKS